MAPLEVGLMTSIGMQATEPAGVPPHPPCRGDEELSTTSAVIVGGFVVRVPFFRYMIQETYVDSICEFSPCVTPDGTAGP